MAFECKIAADSLAPCGARLTTYIVTYPRAIHSEIMTHRMLTKSSASSRAIPVDKLIQRILDDPWVPSYIGANQKGMQPGEELDGDSRLQAVNTWIDARNAAIEQARLLLDLKVHKGVVNRILEPWMWITVIISGTEWENFFGLRCHEAAEPHFQHIARMMRDAWDASVPRILAEGEWHLPLIDWDDEIDRSIQPGDLVKISVGRCARVSYLNHEGKRDLQADIDLHDRLMKQRPLHAAPAEHVAQAMDWPNWYKNERFNNPAELRDFAVRMRTTAKRESGTAPKEGHFRDDAVLGELQSGNYLGFKQYRKTLADEHIGGLMP